MAGSIGWQKECQGKSNPRSSRAPRMRQGSRISEAAASSTSASKFRGCNRKSRSAASKLILCNLPQPRAVEPSISCKNPNAQMAGTTHTKDLRYLSSPARDHPIKQQQNHCPDDRRDESSWLPGLIPAYDSSDVSRDERPRDAEQNGDDATARIFPWHKQFGDGADG